MGRIFPKHGNFFRFLNILNREIEKQSIRFQMARTGRTFIRLHDKPQTKKTNNIISKCTQLLKSGIYNVGKFLQQIVFMDAIKKTSLETKDDIEELDVDICNISNNEENLCLLCRERPRLVAYVPCLHLTQCADCPIQTQCVLCGSNNVQAMILCTY